MEDATQNTFNRLIDIVTATPVRTGIFKKRVRLPSSFGNDFFFLFGKDAALASKVLGRGSLVFRAITPGVLSQTLMPAESE